MIIPVKLQHEIVSSIVSTFKNPSCFTKENIKESYSLFTYSKKVGILFNQSLFTIIFQNVITTSSNEKSTRVILVIHNNAYKQSSDLILSRLKETLPNTDITIQKEIPSGLY